MKYFLFSNHWPYCRFDQTCRRRLSIPKRNLTCSVYSHHMYNSIPTPWNCSIALLMIIYSRSRHIARISRNIYSSGSSCRLHTLYNSRSPTGSRCLANDLVILCDRRFHHLDYGIFPVLRIDQMMVLQLIIFQAISLITNPG